MGSEQPRPATSRSDLPPHRWHRVERPEGEAVVEAYEAIIAGGGPAGLTAAYELTRHGRRCVVVRQELGNTEVEQFDRRRVAVDPDEDIRRLEIAMHDQIAVRELHGVAHGEKQIQPRVDRKLPRIAELRDRLAIDVLHDEVRLPGAR